MLWVLGALLGTESLLRAQNIQASQPAVATEVEEIYIARSVRESRNPPTEFCKGLGECRLTKTDFPEKGMSAWRCFLDLSNLPSGYVGGQLTTNTMNSRNTLGMESDPGGYTQPSIATIRLWKKRDAR
jgi:hypothetical protein